MRAPKPLFLLLLAFVAGSVVVAAAVPAPPQPPAVSLNSEFIFRLEVGAAVLLAAYALAAVLALAYDGEFTRRLGLPGGTGIDTGGAQGRLEDAAGDFDRFKRAVEARLDDHDTAIATAERGRSRIRRRAEAGENRDAGGYRLRCEAERRQAGSPHRGP